MFQLTLLDHIRLTFGQVVYRYKAHVQTAERLARRASQLRAFELSLVAGTVASALAAVLMPGGPFVLLTVGLAGLALIVSAVTMALQIEPRLYAHRWCGARLWLIREKYYALLSELADGAISLEEARSRRDMLMRELHEVYRYGPPIDRPGYQSARKALKASDEAALSDEEIDRFLPQSLRKSVPGADAPWGEGALPPDEPEGDAGRRSSAH
jgi:hypothetical protein